MQLLVGLVLVSLVSAPVVSTGPGLVPTPGMPLSALHAALPDVVPAEAPYRGEVAQTNAQAFGLVGTWTYSFEAGLLAEVSFVAETEGSFSMESQGDTALAKQYDAMRGSVDILSASFDDLYGPRVSSTVSAGAFDPTWLSSGKSADIVEASWTEAGHLVTVAMGFDGDFGMYTTNAAVTIPHFSTTVRFAASKQGTPGPLPGLDVHVGMTVDEVAALHPALFPEGTGANGQWSRPETLLGLSGTWTYDVAHGSLSWVSWRYQVGDGPALTEATFDECLGATEALTAAVTELLGPPTTSTKGKTVFVDPAEDNHYGYEVMETKWILPDKKVRISMDFLGGKAIYSLLVTLEVYEPGYEYF